MVKALMVMTSIIGPAAPAAAQAGGKQFTLEDLNFGGTNYHNMTPRNRWTTWWGDELVRLDVEQCCLVDKKTGRERTLFTLDQMNKWMGTDGENRLHLVVAFLFEFSINMFVSNMCDVASSRSLALIFG